MSPRGFRTPGVIFAYSWGPAALGLRSELLRLPRATRNVDERLRDILGTRLPPDG